MRRARRRERCRAAIDTSYAASALPMLLTRDSVTAYDTLLVAARYADTTPRLMLLRLR